MKIYIASSWKNQHAVEMLTEHLREKGHQVSSFVENSYGEQAGHFATENGTPIPFDKWVNSDRGKKSFEYDTNGATKSDLVIYVGPSGVDTWAEVGAAWASSVPVVGLYAKGESSGLMRRMVGWFSDFRELLESIPDD